MIQVIIININTNLILFFFYVNLYNPKLKSHKTVKSKIESVFELHA